MSMQSQEYLRGAVSVFLRMRYPSKWDLLGRLVQDILASLPHLYGARVEVPVGISDNLRLRAERESWQHQRAGLLHCLLRLRYHRLYLVEARFDKERIMHHRTDGDSAFR